MKQNTLNLVREYERRQNQILSELRVRINKELLQHQSNVTREMDLCTKRAKIHFEILFCNLAFEQKLAIVRHEYNSMLQRIRTYGVGSLTRCEPITVRANKNKFSYLQTEHSASKTVKTRDSCNETYDNYNIDTDTHTLRETNERTHDLDERISQNANSEAGVKYRRDEKFNSNIYQNNLNTNKYESDSNVTHCLNFKTSDEITTINQNSNSPPCSNLPRVLITRKNKAKSEVSKEKKIIPTGDVTSGIKFNPIFFNQYTSKHYTCFKEKLKSSMRSKTYDVPESAVNIITRFTTSGRVGNITISFPATFKDKDAEKMSKSAHSEKLKKKNLDSGIGLSWSDHNFTSISPSYDVMPTISEENSVRLDTQSFTPLVAEDCDEIFKRKVSDTMVGYVMPSLNSQDSFPSILEQMHELDYTKSSDSQDVIPSILDYLENEDSSEEPIRMMGNHSNSSCNTYFDTGNFLDCNGNVLPFAIDSEKEVTNSASVRDGVNTVEQSNLNQQKSKPLSLNSECFTKTSLKLNSIKIQYKISKWKDVSFITVKNNV